MTALMYFLVAVLAGGFGTRAWLYDREDAGRVAFLTLSWSVATAYLGFSLSLLPGLEAGRLLYMAVGPIVPVAAAWTVDRVFSRDQAFISPDILRFVPVALIAGPLGTLAEILFFSPADQRSTSPAEWVTGLVTTALFGMTLMRLWGSAQSATPRVDRTRLTYLLVVTSLSIVATLLEQLARALFPPIDPHSLSIATRGVVLQGPLPPLSVVFTGLAVYLLYNTLVLERLLDLRELLSRLATTLFSAAMLLAVDLVTFVWVDTFTDYPFHSTFQLFLASLMFLTAYDPLQLNLSWVANRLFNRRGQQLVEAMAQVRQQVTTEIRTEGLVDALLSGLHGTGRIPTTSVYLWSRSQDAFLCSGSKGHGDRFPLRVVAAHPFVDGFERGIPWYARYAVERRSRTDQAWAEVLALMDAMNADLTVPFVAGGLVVGWFHVRDERWSDGFSEEELAAFQELGRLGGVLMSNIEDFRALEQKNRLAELGTMAAGLAHEIRNPLAGVKGAAQYLQSEDLPGESQEMLKIILDEADRLNGVVTQFLDYARPFSLHRKPEHVNALVARSLTLLKAQGLPQGVVLVEELGGDLPMQLLDGDHIQQVLLNLLHNAVQAMPHGGTLTVTTRRPHRTDHPVVEIAIEDSGMGISGEDLRKIFVPFYTTKRKGSGLGLAISQRMVQAHKGELEAQSAEGKGSTFTVRLPIEDPDVEPQDAPSQP